MNSKNSISDMSRFCTKKLLPAHPSQIATMAEAIRADFENDGFTVQSATLLSGGCDISITKGELFDALVGQKLALKVTLTPQTGGVLFDASAGIFGQQAIPTIITMFIIWPVIINQTIGLVKQSKLDDRALRAAEASIGYVEEPAAQPATSATPFMSSSHPKFCTECGCKIEQPAKFCPQCGSKL